MSVEFRARALSLYRRLLRAARDWQGAAEVSGRSRPAARGQELLTHRRRPRRHCRLAPPVSPANSAHSKHPPCTQEADYIRKEARQQFRANRLGASSEEAGKAVSACSLSVVLFVPAAAVFASCYTHL